MRKEGGTVVEHGAGRPGRARRCRACLIGRARWVRVECERARAVHAARDRASREFPGASAGAVSVDRRLEPSSCECAGTASPRRRNGSDRRTCGAARGTPGRFGGGQDHVRVTGHDGASGVAELSEQGVAIRRRAPEDWTCSRSRPRGSPLTRSHTARAPAPPPPSLLRGPDRQRVDRKMGRDDNGLCAELESGWLHKRVLSAAWLRVRAYSGRSGRGAARQIRLFVVLAVQVKLRTFGGAGRLWWRSHDRTDGSGEEHASCRLTDDDLKRGGRQPAGDWQCTCKWSVRVD